MSARLDATTAFSDLADCFTGKRGPVPFADVREIVPHLSALARTSWLSDHVESLLSRVAADPFVPLRRADFSFRLSPVATLELRCLSSATRVTDTIVGSGRHRAFAAVGAVPVLLERFRHEGGGSPEVFDPTGRLVRTGIGELTAGEGLALEAWCDVAVVLPTDGVALELMLDPVHTAQWQYDRKTLSARGLSASVLQTGRLERYIATAVSLGGPDLQPTLEHLTHHPAHYVRWAAFRALLETAELPSANQLLARASDDDHPEIRQVARDVMARLSSGEWSG